MTKQKTTKKALLMSALSLFVCVSMLIGSTFAWFTDSVTSGGNKIVAGTLDVQLLMDSDVDGNYDDISDSTQPIFGAGSIAQNNNAETLWEPGKTQVAYLAIKNNGNLALKYTVGLDVQNVSKDLYKVMEYAIIADADANNKVTAWEGGNDVVVGTQSVSDSVSLAAGATHYFALAIHMDETAGNEYQGGEVNFDLTVLATQDTVEEDSFGNQYDKNAMFPGEVSTAAELQAALEQGGFIKLVNNIEFPAKADDVEELDIDASNSIIDLNGKTLSMPYMSAVLCGENVTIKNGTLQAIDSRYVFIGGEDYETNNVVLENVTVNGGINIYNASNITLKECVVNNTVKYYAVWADEDVANVVIESGTYNGADGYVAVNEYVQGSVSIKGGTFNTDVSGYVAAGYVATENNGTWTVAMKEHTVSDSTELKGAIQEGGKITLTTDIETTEVLQISADTVIEGNGNDIDVSATRGFRITNSNVAVTMNNVVVDTSAVGAYNNDARGISIDGSLTNVTLTLNNCTVDFEDGAAADWAYGVNISGGTTNSTIIINGGYYEGANVVNIWGTGNTVIVDGAILNCTYGQNSLYYGAGVRLNEGCTADITVKNTTINGTNAVAFCVDGVIDGTYTYTEENVVDNTKTTN